MSGNVDTRLGRGGPGHRPFRQGRLRRNRRSLLKEPLVLASGATVAGLTATAGVIWGPGLLHGKGETSQGASPEGKASAPPKPEEPTPNTLALINDPDLIVWRQSLPPDAKATIMDHQDTEITADVVVVDGVKTHSRPSDEFPLSRIATQWTWFDAKLNPDPVWNTEVLIETPWTNGAKVIERWAVITRLNRPLPPGEKPLPEDFFPVFAAIDISYSDPSGKQSPPSDRTKYQTYMKVRDAEKVPPAKAFEWKLPQPQQTA